MTRHEAREQALDIIFERLFKDEPLPETIELAKEAREITPNEFTQKLTEGVCEHLDEIDQKIEQYSIGWSKSRLSRVVLSILRLSVFEICYLKETPVSVCINEAVELAKKFAGEGDSGFINGVLGTMVRTEKIESVE